MDLPVKVQPVGRESSSVADDATALNISDEKSDRWTITTADGKRDRNTSGHRQGVKHLACEDKWAALDSANLALDTSMLALDAAIAVVKANVLAVKAAQIDLAICLGVQLGDGADQ